MPKRLAVAIVGLIIAIPLFSACGGNQNVQNGSDGAASGQELPAVSPQAVQKEEEKSVSVSIACAGDVMVHEPQLVAQFDNKTKLYDFSNNFEYVKDYIASADLAMCNLETTLGGSPYTGYPRFSSPDSLVTALADTGFDVLFTSNNHMLDRDADGLRKTIDGVRAAGLRNVGSQYEDEKKYIVVSAGAIDVGIVAYTYESPRVGNTRTLNGIRITDESLPMVNSFGYEDLEGDLDDMAADVLSARKDGADVVICYFHWGNEYQRAYDDTQRYIAGRAITAGADLIFASHPHVLQTMEIIEAENGRRIPLFYSMGNFISNQRTETTGSMYTEQGLIAMVELEVLPDSGKIVSVEAKALPTWLDKYYSGGKQTYTIVPLDAGYEGNPAILESGHLGRAAEALKYCGTLFRPEDLYKGNGDGAAQ
ncbi:MAG: CapA family protein [Clostridiales Family XIII bacterium]|nr:CapA family protein [Clostridiales Family XIII bacterium]